MNRHKWIWAVVPVLLVGVVLVVLFSTRTPATLSDMTLTECTAWARKNGISFPINYEEKTDKEIGLEILNVIVMTEQDPKYRSERTGTVGYGVDMRIKAAVQRHYNASPWALFRWTPTPVKLSDQTAAQAVEWVRAQGIEIPDSMEKRCTEKVIGYYVLRTMVQVEQDPGYVSPWENRTWAEFETQVAQAVDTYYELK